MDKLKIRRYKASDNSVVWELHRLGLAEIGVEPSLDNPLDQDLSDIENIYLKEGDFIVGELDGSVVAMGAFKSVSEEVAELKRMRVNPKFQRQGFGQQILDELEKRAKEKGFNKMILDTNDKWFKAKNFYKKNGYIETGRTTFIEKGYNVERSDAIFYEKKLI